MNAETDMRRSATSIARPEAEERDSRPPILLAFRGGRSLSSSENSPFGGDLLICRCPYLSRPVGDIGYSGRLRSMLAHRRRATPPDPDADGAGVETVRLPCICKLSLVRARSSSGRSSSSRAPRRSLAALDAERTRTSHSPLRSVLAARGSALIVDGACLASGCWPHPFVSCGPSLKIAATRAIRLRSV